MLIILLIIFFVPGILTIMEFLIFLTKGTKSFNGVFGFLLDLTHVIIILAPSEMELHATALGFILSAIVGYFSLVYFHTLLSANGVKCILVILGCAIFLNLYMIFNQEIILSYFNLPILLLLAMQISINADRLLEKNKHSISSR